MSDDAKINVSQKGWRYVELCGWFKKQAYSSIFDTAASLARFLGVRSGEANWSVGDFQVTFVNVYQPPVRWGGGGEVTREISGRRRERGCYIDENSLFGVFYEFWHRTWAASIYHTPPVADREVNSSQGICFSIFPVSLHSHVPLAQSLEYWYSTNDKHPPTLIPTPSFSISHCFISALFLLPSCSNPFQPHSHFGRISEFIHSLRQIQVDSLNKHFFNPLSYPQCYALFAIDSNTRQPVLHPSWNVLHLWTALQGHSQWDNNFLIREIPNDQQCVQSFEKYIRSYIFDNTIRLTWL